MEYVTTGLTDDLDTRIHGFPRGGISVINGSPMLVQQSWVDEQVKNNNATVISTLRTESLLNTQLPDEAITYSGNISDGLDSVDFSGESLVIESNNSLPIEKIIQVASENNIAVVVVTTEAYDDLCYSSSIILNIEYEKELNNNMYNMYLIVKKHIYDVPDDRVLSLKYRPEPFVEKRKKA